MTWSGRINAAAAITGTEYGHNETQTWELGGLVSSEQVNDVTREKYNAIWTASGAGGIHVGTKNEVTWNFNVTQLVEFQFTFDGITKVWRVTRVGLDAEAQVALSNGHTGKAYECRPPPGVPIIEDTLHFTILGRFRGSGGGLLDRFIFQPLAGWFAGGIKGTLNKDVTSTTDVWPNDFMAPSNSVYNLSWSIRFDYR